VRDENGEPNGWITEGAAWQLAARHFPVDGRSHERAVRRFLDYLSSRGVVAVYDGGNFLHEDRVYGLLARLERNGELPLRYEGTYQIFLPHQKEGAIAGLARLKRLYGGNRLRFNTIKLFMDGITKNRTAAMLEPYADDPANRGNTMMTTDELCAFLSELHEARADLHVHVLGDRAVRTVLDAVQCAKQSFGDALYPRVTLAHVGIVDPADYSRFASLGVVANFTPQWHGVVDDDPVMHVLGAQRYARTLVVKPLLDAGAIVSFSSDDWTIEDLSPFLGIQVGHTRRFPPTRQSKERKEARGNAEIRGPESERLDLETLVRGYTRNGAYQLRMDGEIGSIEVGKRADLVALEENLFAMDAADIAEIVPTAVVVEGELVHGKLR
jgi:predicted amidohydrolase YtcJ